ncbi:unnamed protein product [Cercopithifilaria johnstoni]|uniref:Uncharacterized protein n=1 Tax=Cercopithifilaria johnstoni TaxID=2874296 RepID=A0A8J2LQL9_9BILA|nr:unnamed protein product [Cercopithifilaria johnstoni]
MNSAQKMIRQCMCDEVEPCKTIAVKSILPCADKCQKYISSISRNYQQIRSCFQQKQQVINGTIMCSQNSFPNSCVHGRVANLIPRRYTKSIELAAMNEINKDLHRMGIADQIASILTQGRHFFRCFQSCMTRRLDKCTTGCGLDLPPDNAVVQIIKTCAINMGLHTATIQDLCFCLNNAGIQQLADICPRVQI